jgi:hypothetical protein
LNLRTIKKRLKEFKLECNEANKKDDSQEKFMKLEDLNRQMDLYDTGVEYLKTTYYESQCNKLGIPIPDKNDNVQYYKFNFDDHEGEVYILKDKGFHDLRNQIREERKYFRDIFGFYLSLLIGVIGALTALVSVLRKG